MARRNESTLEQQETQTTGQSTTAAQSSDPTHEEIAARAYECWQQRGGAHGLHEEDWYRAEQELRAEKAATAQSARSAAVSAH